MSCCGKTTIIRVDPVRTDLRSIERLKTTRSVKYKIKNKVKPSNDRDKYRA